MAQELKLRVPDGLKSALDERARRDERSMNWVAVRALEQFLGMPPKSKRGDPLEIPVEVGAEHDRAQAGGPCPHPKDREVKLAWGVKCGVCDTKIR